MQRRHIAHGDWSLPALSFGTGGNAGLMVRGTALDQARVIARAIERGVTHFDTAPDYGDGAAEEALGRALKHVSAPVSVCTKVEIRACDRDTIADHIVRSVESSLRRLQRDAVDVVQIHNAPTLSDTPQAPHEYLRLPLSHFTESGGALEGLERLRQAGKAHRLGFICRADDHEPAARLIETGAFHLLNVSYSLLDTRAGEDRGVIPLARAHGVGVAIYSPLAGGLLTDEDHRRSVHPLARARPDTSQTRAARERVRTLRALLPPDVRLAEAAIGFALMHPGVTTVIGGFSDLAQVEDVADLAERTMRADTRAAIQTFRDSEYEAGTLP